MLTMVCSDRVKLETTHEMMKRFKHLKYDCLASEADVCVTSTLISWMLECELPSKGNNLTLQKPLPLIFSDLQENVSKLANHHKWKQMASRVSNLSEDEFLRIWKVSLETGFEELHRLCDAELAIRVARTGSTHLGILSRFLHGESQRQQVLENQESLDFHKWLHLI